MKFEEFCKELGDYDTLNVGISIAGLGAYNNSFDVESISLGKDCVVIYGETAIFEINKTDNIEKVEEGFFIRNGVNNMIISGF